MYVEYVDTKIRSWNTICLWFFAAYLDW